MNVHCTIANALCTPYNISTRVLYNEIYSLHYIHTTYDIMFCIYIILCTLLKRVYYKQDSY